MKSLQFTLPLKFTLLNSKKTKDVKNIDLLEPFDYFKKKELNMKKIICLAVLITMTSSCSILTKPLTVPIRIVAAVVSIIPFDVGNKIHSAMDEVADGIDGIL